MEEGKEMITLVGNQRHRAGGAAVVESDWQPQQERYIILLTTGDGTPFVNLSCK